MKYLITHLIEAEDLHAYIAKVGGIGKNSTIEALTENLVKVPGQVLVPKARMAKAAGNGAVHSRKKREGSTVNSAVLSAMASGPASTAALKDALTAAGKKPSSLPTALAALQKSGEIERVGTGQYQLKYHLMSDPASQAAE
jgi:hypothetical protein